MNKRRVSTGNFSHSAFWCFCVLLASLFPLQIQAQAFIYANEEDELYIVENLDTVPTTTLARALPLFFDIGVDSNGVLYGIESDGDFFIIDPDPLGGAPTFVGTVPITAPNFPNSLSFNNNLAFTNSGTQIVTFDPANPAAGISTWLDLGFGSSGGDIIILSDRAFVSWVDGAGQAILIEVALNSAGLPISFQTLGTLPTNNFGLAAAGEGVCELYSAGIDGGGNQGLFLLDVPASPIAGGTGAIPTILVSTSASGYFGAAGDSEASCSLLTDWGDAPESYGTSQASPGPSHSLRQYDEINFTSLLMIGTSVDHESDGQPSINADGDDNDLQSDDEDGVSWATALLVGENHSETVVVTNNSSEDAFLSAWVDFNIDGDFNDPGENIAANQLVPNSAVSSVLNFSVPMNAEVGTTYSRVRLCLNSGECDTPTGGASSGEVEDNNNVLIRGREFGDLPDVYGTTVSSSGPLHQVTVFDSTTNVANLMIGATLDHEQDGIPSVGADGDNTSNINDENGVTFSSPAGGNRGNITATVTVTNTTGSNAIVCGWLDRYDGSGNPTGTLSVQDNADVCEEQNVDDLIFIWDALEETEGFTYTRFRVCLIESECNNANSGEASIGEIEDYRIQFNFDPTIVSLKDFSISSVSISQLNLEREGMLSLLSGLDHPLSSSLVDASHDEILDHLGNYLDPDSDGNIALLEWETLFQSRTFGFYVERQENGDAWQRVNNQLLPAMIDAPLGANYMLIDRDAVAGRSYRYRLIEVESTGNKITYGPYDLVLPH